MTMLPITDRASSPGAGAVSERARTFKDLQELHDTLLTAIFADLSETDINAFRQLKSLHDQMMNEIAADQAERKLQLTIEQARGEAAKPIPSRAQVIAALEKFLGRKVLYVR